MKLKLKKRIFILALVMCYCLGSLLVPTYADESSEDEREMSGFDELLAERENADTETSGENEIQPEKADISDFTDVSERDWYYSYLDYLVKNGMINGKTPTTFEGQSTFSYAECSAVIVRYLGLEKEAALRQAEIVKRKPDLKNVWYAGYFETLLNLGLFNQYDLFEAHDGILISVNREIANSPIVRYRFAESISMSFELDSALKAKNVYSEIGGAGREFIVGGGYKEDILEQYEERIKDFSDIPEESRQYILKSYYNGIFNGDISGNFYPHNNLTRSEMAKVLATVSDYSLRTRLIEDGYGGTVTEDILHTDFAGVKTLDYYFWTELLLNEAKNLDVGDGIVSYISGSSAPMGYAIDVYLYEKTGKSYELCNECTLHEANGGEFSEDINEGRVLFVLRNVGENARPEGVFDVTIENGSISSMKPLIRELM